MEHCCSSGNAISTHELHLLYLWGKHFLILKLGRDAAFLARRYLLTRDNSRLITKIYELSPSQGQKQSHRLMETGAILVCSALLHPLLVNTSAGLVAAQDTGTRRDKP